MIQIWSYSFSEGTYGKQFLVYNDGLFSNVLLRYILQMMQDIGGKMEFTFTFEDDS